jgi:hypothetical protein
MALQKTKRNLEVNDSIEKYKESAINSTGVLTSIVTQLDELRTEITVNADEYFDAADITFVDAKINQVKTLISNLNTAAQNL